MPEAAMISLDRKLMVAETRMVTQKMVTTHFACFFCSRLVLSGSVFDTGILLDK